MRGGTKTIVIMGMLFVIAMMYGNLTGAAFRTSADGSIRGERPELSDHEFTRIEILAEEINEEGLPVIEQGKNIRFIIDAGWNKVHTGFQLENAVSGLRFEGGHCHPGTTGDFCSASYTCIGGDCKTGPKCSGQKLVTERIPEALKPGKYAVTVCDARDECCEFEIRQEFVVVEKEPGDNFYFIQGVSN